MIEFYTYVYLQISLNVSLFKWMNYLQRVKEVPVWIMKILSNNRYAITWLDKRCHMHRVSFSLNEIMSWYLIVQDVETL